MNITVDNEFYEHIDREVERYTLKLSKEEYEQLEANIVAEGVKEPLTVNTKTGFILDGHKRYKICKKYNIPYSYIDIREVEALADCQIWALENQLKIDLTATREEQYKAFMGRFKQMGSKESERSLFGLLGSLVQKYKEAAKDNQNRQKEWIAARRAEAPKLESADCCICKKHAIVAEAHHVVPLHIQYFADRPFIDTVEWLCPTHHKLLHKIINSMLVFGNVERTYKYFGAIDSKIEEAKICDFAVIAVEFARKHSALIEKYKARARFCRDFAVVKGLQL